MITMGTRAQPIVPPVELAMPITEGVPFDPEEIASLALIRQHTKTDDILRVTDEQLALYRASAIEAAEMYTGLLIGHQKRMTEKVRLPQNYSHSFKRSYKHRTKYPVAAEDVYVFGPGIPGHTGRFTVEIGRRDLRLPNVFHSADFSSCCNPCGNNSPDGGMFTVMYLAGYSCVADIPRGIILGMLKFIAWSIENPGDVYQSVRGNAQRGTGAQDGSNNAALASGALEQWRMYNNDAV